MLVVVVRMIWFIIKLQARCLTVDVPRACPGHCPTADAFSVVAAALKTLSCCVFGVKGRDVVALWCVGGTDMRLK